MSDRVQVLGWYGKNNIGDEAYKVVFPALFPQHEFVFSDDLDKNSRPSDYLVLGGGNVVSDEFLTQVERIKVPKLLLSAGIPTREDSRRPVPNLYGRLKDTFSHICVRDFASFDALYSRGIEVSYLPDFTFALRPDKARGRELIKKYFKQDGLDLYEKVVGVVVNGFLIAGSDLLARDYITFHKNAFDIARCADHTNASFLFLPFGGDPMSNDRIPNAWVASRCKWWKKNCVVYDRLSVKDTLDIVAACDTMINSRLHASIFSTIGGTPFVDLTHHDKNRLYLESIAKTDWSLDYWMLDYHKMLNLVQEHLKNPGAGKELLLISSINRQSLIANVSRFLPVDPKDAADV